MDEEERKNIGRWVIAVIALILIIALFTGGFGLFRNKDNAEQNMTVFENASLYPSIGPQNAKYTIVEFSDFQCPYCAIASGLPNWTGQYQSQYGDLLNISSKIKNLTQNNESSVRFIYVPMSFLGQESVDSAEAALCANDQGKFWEMHDRIFRANTGNENNGTLSNANLKIMAQSINGMNVTRFNNCLDNNEKSDEVQRISNTARDYTNATPVFYVNGKRAPTSWAQISKMIEE